MSNLYVLVDKLGHSLEEIRLRALNNLVTKLDCGLLVESELIDQDGMFAKLLNWFEFGTVPEKEKVLKLILKLVKAGNGEGGVLLLRADPGLARLRSFHDHDIIVQDIIKIVTNECNSARYQPPIVLESTKPSIEFVYKEPAERDVKLPSSFPSQNDLISCFQVWSLPWVPLVHSDTHVLSAVEDSLRDDDNALQSCQFFVNIVLQDFSAEVFLQRPGILKGLVDLLKKPFPLNSAAAVCLSHFTQSLHERLNNLYDPSMTSFKLENFEDTIKTESRPDMESLFSSPYSSLHHEDSLNKTYSYDVDQLPLTQLSVPQYCIMALINVIELIGSCPGVSSPLLPRLLHLFSKCLVNKKLVWSSPHPVVRDLNHHMHFALVILASTVQNSFVKEPIERLHMIIMAIQILKSLVPTAIAATSVPSQLQEHLTRCLLDPAISLMYPQVHKLLLKYIKAFKTNGEKLFLNTKRVNDSMTASMEFSRSASNIMISEALNLLETSLLSLPFHKEFSIISLFIQLCTEEWKLTDDDQTKASCIARSLLAHTDTDITSEMYKVCQEKVITILGPNQAARSNDPIQSVSFLLNSSLLSEIICHGMTNNNLQIKEAAQDILMHIVKCRLLIPQSSWEHVLEQILPVLPLLQSHASKDTSFGRCVLNMTDPDVAKATSLPKLQVVSGNIRLLLHKDSLCREEGCARILWMLKFSRPVSRNLQDICIIEKAIVSKPPATGLYEVGSVVRVLEVLTGPCVEARVRQSALVQLSVMTEDTRLHNVFFEQQGMATLLYILQSNVDEWQADVKGYVIPIVTVMKNLARYNSKVRLQLSQNVSFYLCILKGLFLLKEWRLQRDATQLLALLVFADFLITTTENISFPQLAVENYILPFVCSTHWTVSPYSQHTNKGELVGNKLSQTLLGIHWAMTKEGSMDKVLEWTHLPGDLPTDLCISLQSLRHIQKSAISYNCKKLLYNIQNATTHKNATEAIQQLRCYLELEWLVENHKLAHLPWQETFHRFLITTPSCSEDYQLLIIVLEFLIFLVGLIKEEIKWIALGLQSTPQPLLKFLSVSNKTVEERIDHADVWEEIYMKILNLCEICMKQGVDASWSTIVQVIKQSLDYSHTQNFYSLGLLANKLRCLQEQLPLHSIDVSVLWILLSAFHCDTPQSCMGLSITRHILYCLNSLLASIITNQVWEIHWIKEENLRWLPSLWLSRDVIIRASTLQLLAGMCISKTATAAILQCISTIWDQALRFVVDHMEASLVREQAAILCTNIASNTKGQVCVTSALEIGLCREFAVAVTQLSLEDKIDLDVVSHIADYSNKAESIVSDFELIPTTPGFITTGCWLINNLMSLNKQQILHSIHEDGLEGALFRCLLEWKTIRTTESMRMYSIICSLLCYSVTSNPIMAAQVVPAVIRLLDPSSFDLEENSKDIKKLWREAWRFLCAILFFNDINITLPTPIVTTLCENISQSTDSKLQLSALLAVPAMTSALDDESAVRVCRSLLDQWHQVTGKKKTALVHALTSIVGTGQDTTTVAFDQGLLQSLVIHLREILVGLTVKVGHIQHLKKGNRLLNDLDIHFGLACNFLVGATKVKLAAAELGFADLLHKLWVWCQIDDQLMLKALHTLITFTADCAQSAHTLVLTSTMSGVGQRKTPCSHSLIHALIVLLTKENHPLEIQRCSLELMSHACQAHECRIIIIKSNLLQSFTHSWQDKKQTSEQTELMWLQFLNIFTYFPEGQQVLPKIGDLLNLIIQCAESGRLKSRLVCVSVLYNISINPFNKSRLLTSELFLSLLGEKLLSGNDEEKHKIALIVWSLAANSQKAKAVLRNKGLCSRLQLAEATQSNELFSFVRNLLQPAGDS